MARDAQRSDQPPPVSGGGRFELPAYLSNGIVGLRVSEVALTGGIAMVSGFSGEDPVKQIEAAVQAPYPLAGDVSINGVVHVGYRPCSPGR